MLGSVSSNWVVTLVTLVVSFVLTPYMIHVLGEDGYGTWTLVVSLTSYLLLLSLGVPMASVRYFAEHVARGDSTKLNEAVGSSIVLYLLMGFCALVIGTGLYVIFLLSYDVPDPWQAEARVAFAIVVVQIAIGFVALVPEGILAAHHDFVTRNVVLVAAAVLRLVLTWVLLALKASIVFLAIVQIACLVFDFTVAWILIRWRHPSVRMRVASSSLAMVRRILSFSFYVLLLAVGARLVFQTDAIVIGAFLRVGDIPFYAVANGIVLYLIEMVGAIAIVVMPLATKLKAQNESRELTLIFLKWSKIALSLTMLASIFLFVLGPQAIGWWIDPSFEASSGQALRILVVSCIAFLPVIGVVLPILMGIGRPQVPAVSYVLTGLVNLLMSIALVRPLGLSGVALGTAIPNVVFAAIVLLYACRQLGLSFWEYTAYVMPRPVVGIVPALLVVLFFKFALDAATFVELAGAGLATGFLYGVTCIVFVYRNDPLVDVRGGLARALAWRGSRSSV